MGANAELIVILRDLVQFLETLCDVNLPNGLGKIRDNLLQRTKENLIVVDQQCSTPEHYLDMNAGIGKGLQPIEKADVNSSKHDKDITEYMYTDNSNPPKLLSQDYYETFPTNISTSKNSNENTIPNNTEQKSNDLQDELRCIYQSFSTEQTINKAVKSGPLHLKEERRLFGFQLFGGFDQYRSCFIGLVGTHLLFYGTKHDKHPSDIISISGYSARASPNALPRDLERSKAAFEIFSPGDKTYQFIARSSKEMEQWVAVIRRAGNINTNSVKSNCHVTNSLITNEMTFNDSNSINSKSSTEQYQDVGSLITKKQLQSLQLNTSGLPSNENSEIILRNNEKLTTSTSVSQNVISPPLPARIPRRLPSLPHEHPPLNFDLIDDGYDEDDIYHKIEDFKQPVGTYQNLALANVDSNASNVLSESKEKSQAIKPEITDNSKLIPQIQIEIYDDAKPANSLKPNHLETKRITMTYDDIRPASTETSNEILRGTKKKSFLERVRNKKEFSLETHEEKSKKLETKSNVIGLQCRANEKMPTYDDVIDLGMDFTLKNDEDMGMYTFPPAPRAIHEVSSTILAATSQNLIQEIYDDIGMIGNNRDNAHLNQIDVNNTIESLQIKTSVENDHNEIEHYQVPRSRESISNEVQIKIDAAKAEELYDDIAIIANFRARQRDSICSTNSSTTNKKHSSTTNVIKVWNRIASGRKMKKKERQSVYKNEQLNDDEGMILEVNGEDAGSKLNKFQKLINKMESSLNKPKPIAPMTNNNSQDDKTN